MKKLVLNTALLLAATVMTAKAQHDPEHTITQSPLKIVTSKIINNEKINNQEVKLVYVAFAPGEVSGEHRHPMPAIAYVLEGELESTFDGKVQIFKKGDTFYEDPNLLHAKTKNMSKTKPAALLVYFIGDPGVPYITVDQHK